MKFKDGAIKPGMTIHCLEEEDTRALLEHLEEMGFKWNSGDLPTKRRPLSENYNCYHLYNDMTIACDRYEYYAKWFGEITEFSDLIEPEPMPMLANIGKWKCKYTDGGILEGFKCDCGHVSIIPNKYCPSCGKNMHDDSPMSAVEVLKWLSEHDGTPTMQEVTGCMSVDSIWHEDPEELIQRITAYEAAKKAPKPVEVEWVDVCKITEIFDDGITRVVYREELKPGTPFDKEREQTEAILKKYISEHEGRYIAVVERVCRVKEDKC